MHIKAQRSADTVIVGTPDLIHLVKGSVLVHIPIDTDHFNRKLNVTRPINERAVLINSEVTDVEQAIDYCRRKGLDLNIQIYDRTKNPISYKDFPNFLKNYDIYVDLRFVNNKLLRNLSTTALQALACGLRVLNYNLEFIDKLPVDYPMNVTNRLSSIYYQKRNKFELAKLVLEQFPLDIVYGIYSSSKKCGVIKKGNGKLLEICLDPLYTVGDRRILLFLQNPNDLLWSTILFISSLLRRNKYNS